MRFSCKDISVISLMACSLMLSASGLNAATKAVAVVNPTKGNQAEGTVTFTAVSGGGVQIVADIDGLTPGKHGFHILEKGDCSETDGLFSIGKEFNPTGSRHGSPNSADRYVGDLGNINVDSNGHGHYERLDSIIALDGPNNIIGRAIVVHANEDDLSTQPNGNVGAVNACGVIKAAQ